MGMWFGERKSRSRTNTEESSIMTSEVVAAVAARTNRSNAKGSKSPTQHIIKMQFFFRKRRQPIKLTTIHSPLPLLDEVSVVSSDSSSIADESKRERHVRFCTTPEYIEQGEAGQWYTKEELVDIEADRWAEQQRLSRGLDRRGDRSYGMVLYRMLMRFRHHPTDEVSFLVDSLDFNLLERYSLRHEALAGMERAIARSVASETQAMVGTVQQSVLMVQDMIQGDDNAAECIRVASIRYSTTSQRFARALGEVHASIAKRF